MSDVFISYSRKNSDFARKLIDRLTLANKDSWVDWEGIPLSAPNWWAEIKVGIESADNFIFIMTPDSMASIVCNMELDYAFELGKRVIPIVHETVAQQEVFATIADYQPDESMTDRLSGKQPLDIANHNWQELSHINWTFFREDDDFDDAFQTLLRTVETDLDYVKAHTRYLTRAQEWQRNQQRDDLLLFGEEIDYAEQWLLKGDAYASQQSDKRDIVNPLPRALHRDYILASRQADRQRKRLARSAQLSIAVLALAVIGGGIFAVFALNALNTQIDDANNQLSTATQVLFDVQTDVADSDNQLATATQALQLVSTTVADANTQLSAVPPTLTEVNGQIALAEEQVNQASTQVAQSNQQLATATQALVTATYVAELEAQAQVTLAVANTQVVDALVTVTQASIEREITTNFANAILQNVNSPAEQLRLMDEIVADYPDQATSYIARGIVLSQQGEEELAIADYDRAIELDPTNPVSYNNRGTSYLDLGELELALLDFDRAIELDDTYFEALANRGIVHDELGNSDLALADLNTALELNPQSSDAYTNRAGVYFTLMDYDLALTDANMAIDLNPSNAEAWSTRGTIYSSLENYDLALADLDTAIKLNPNLSDAYRERGIVIFISSGVPDEETILLAIDDLNQAIELGDVSAYLIRGLAYFFLEDYDATLEDFNTFEAEGGILDEETQALLDELEALVDDE